MIFRLKMHFSNVRNVLSDRVQGNLSTLEAFDDFVKELLHTRLEDQSVSETEIYRILHAMEFAAKRHETQTRYNVQKTPYIIHPLHVAYHLLTLGHVHDTEILMAALLHDTIEDTQTSLEELRNEFGYRVEKLVQELSDDKSLSQKERKRLQIQNASKKSLEASLIVLADKLSNLSDLLENPPVDWNQDRIMNYFLWAQEVVRHLPPVNPMLSAAIDEIIEKYWKRLAESEFGE